MLISVVVIGVVYAGYTFIRPFESGVNELGRDVRDVLSGQSIGGVGRGSSTGSPSSGAPGGTGTGTGTGTATGSPGASGSQNGRSIANSDLMAPRIREEPPADPRIRNTVGPSTIYSAPPPGANDG